ncbi:type VI secretion system baseplate subunit TssG [Sulfurimonas sp.]|uniref:type VI secretion system baseplate subunit TssG n=1 Tax=Sulfurimonas sp. TaxID=2022749 RepID=UPI002B49ED80|nr:type VI secretion system baseplate subunit TssG [Sulfurimonas sp.]
MTIIELNKKIKSSIGKYPLAQGIRVAMTYLRTMYPKEEPQALYERLRFKSNPSLAFAKSEISKMEFVETPKGKNVEITLNFLGLFGAASPLPSHYCEMVLDSSDTDKVLQDFLDLFNHHIQKMFYPIWQRQRYYIQYQSDLTDKFSKYMLSLLGLYSETQVKSSTLNFQKILPYIGLLSMKQKSAGTLVSILRHYLEHDELEIVQCIEMNEKIPSWQLAGLGEENCTLGLDLLLGESVKTKGSKFQILLRDISFNSLYKYSLHGEKIGELKELIDFALNEPLEYELCLEIQKDKTEPFELSKHYLGVNCFCGAVEKDEKIILSS